MSHAVDSQSSKSFSLCTSIEGVMRSMSDCSAQILQYMAN